MKDIVETADAPAAIGPYSQAARFGSLVVTSGQIPLRPDGTLVEGGIEAQTARSSTTSSPSSPPPERTSPTSSRPPSSSPT